VPNFFPTTEAYTQLAVSQWSVIVNLLA